MNLGGYHMPGAGKMNAGQDPRMARLRAACKGWEYRSHPDGGVLLIPKGSGLSLADLGAPVDCADGLRWHPPRTLPTLHDLAREEMPQPATTVTLRRCGTVSVPLGVGPVYGSGPKKGRPSSEFGHLAQSLFQRAQDRSHEWDDQDISDTERLIYLALVFGYALTDELWAELAPYDADEAEPILGAIWGVDPKASASDGRTSPPSPQEPSAIPG